MPKSKTRRSKSLCDKFDDLTSIISNDGDFHFTDDDEATNKSLNNLGSICSTFPVIIQKLIRFLPTSDHKNLRLCSKSLKTAVDQYVGLNFILSESNFDYGITKKITVLNKQVKTALKTVGIRSLVGIQLSRIKFHELLTFPYLLQSIQLVGRVDHHVFLGILKECFNIQQIKFQEPSAYQKLVSGNLTDFLQSLGIITEKRKKVRMDRLKNVQIYCSTTSTMGFMLAFLSVLEAKNLEDLQCCIGPIHANFYCLISGLIVNLINTACNRLKGLSIIIDSGDAYPEITAKRRLIRKLAVLDDYPNILPTFTKTLEKLYWSDEDRDQWLRTILSEAGTKTQLETLRLDIDTMEDFTNNWQHFVKHQRSLKTLELQTCCGWTLIENVVKQNSKTLEKLSLVMEFSSVMNMEDFLQNCSNLKYLHMKNYDCEELNPAALEMRRSGHIINAKFDELLPNLQGLSLCDLLIRCDDMGRIRNLKKLKSFMYSLVDVFVNEQRVDYTNMFGLLFEDFKSLLHQRGLNHLILSVESIVCYGPEDKILKDEVNMANLLRREMFHEATIFDWQPNLSIDDEHVAVAHGETIALSDWFFPFLMSVIEDSVVTDMLWTRSLVEDE